MPKLANLHLLYVLKNTLALNDIEELVVCEYRAWVLPTQNCTRLTIDVSLFMLE